MMKKTLLILSVVYFVTPFSINAMDPHDGEMQTMEFAGRARMAGTYGFQGCINKERCGNHGFYLAQYSPEGLCKRCEFEKFPTRFVACLFCRKPEKKYRDDIRSFSCLNCESAIKDALKCGIEHRDYSHLDVLKSAIRQYLFMADVLQGRKFVAPFIDLSVREKVFGEYYHGLIMYKGALQLPNGNLRHVWQKRLDVSGFDKYLVKIDRTRADWWHEGEPLVRGVCEKYNVFGPETGAPLSAPVAGETATYDEVVAKFPSPEVGTAVAGVGLLR